MDTSFTAFDLKVRDGRAVHVRAMCPSDEAELLQAFGRLSDEVRYLRFMRTVREPNRERLRKVLASFPKSGAAVVATVPAADGFDIVGSAVFFIESNPEKCEFAMTVANEYCGVGLGRALLVALIGVAIRRGLSQMEGFVLAVNTPMQRLAARGFQYFTRP